MKSRNHDNPSRHAIDTGRDDASQSDATVTPGELSETSEAPESMPARSIGYTQEAMDLAVCTLAKKRGMALDEEVDACKDAHARTPDEQTLGEILVTRQVLTPRQYERLCADVEAERTGQRIPGYAMLAKIGAGASATVFKARQTSLNRLVAIKVLPRRYSSHQDFIDRFYDEGRAAAKLNHPGIVQAYDVGQADACHYFVMEYVEGRTAYEIIQHNGTLEEAAALEMVIQLAEALEHAHEAGLIHRDVKPKNIIVTETGQAKLADLGLARAIADVERAEAEAGQTFGTPYYMSPEQARGDKEIGPPADIYALGATFYHMLTGKPPFPGSRSSEVMESHLNEQPIPPEQKVPAITPGISDVVIKMLAKDIADRYAGCGELLDELRAWRSFHILKKGESSR